MRSSGIKRSMAAIAISAVAVAGIPALAMANSIDSQVTGWGGPTSTQLYNTTVSGGGVIDLTAKNDGTDTTVRLEAGGGINVPRVTFQFQKLPGGAWTDIATVERNDDGAFSHEWNPTAFGVFGGDSVNLRTVNAADPLNAGLYDTDGPFVLRLATAANTQAINIAADTQRGYFKDTTIGVCAPNTYHLGVAGTTSVLRNSPPLGDNPGIAWMDGAGNEQDFTFNTSNDAGGTWEGTLTFSNATYTFDDPALPPAEPDQMVVRAVTDTTSVTEDQTDDFEAFTLYRQVLTSVTATLNPRTEPDPGTVTVTALDQDSKPIAGIEIYPAGGGGPVGVTDGRGQVVTPQADAINYYYANATCAGGFSPAAGDKRSNDVNNQAAVVDITTAPSDGNVPIGTTVTETIKVTDTNGDPISNRPVRIKRTGPSDNGETVFKTTNDNGELTYTFNCNVEGVASLEVGISGPVAPLADPFTYAIGYDTVNCQNPPPDPGPVAINAKLRGHSSAGRDVLTVNAPGLARGAVVRLQKRSQGQWVTIKTKRLDGAGDRKMGVKDRNGKKVTKYRAKVSPTSRTFADTTPFKRLK